MLTLQRFVSELEIATPSAIQQSLSPLQFHYNQLEYGLCSMAKTRIERYLSKATLTRAPFGSIVDAQAVVAFSFGDSEEVNRKLADEVGVLYRQQPALKIFAQQEIAQHLSHLPVTPISNEGYQTTADVAKAAYADVGNKAALVVAQSWHAQRCIDTCEQTGLNVQGLRVSEEFPSNDPQPWVRNPINWIIKESFRDISTGHETSQRFGLC